MILLDDIENYMTYCTINKIHYKIINKVSRGPSDSLIITYEMEKICKEEYEAATGDYFER